MSRTIRLGVAASLTFLPLQLAWAGTIEDAWGECDSSNPLLTSINFGGHNEIGNGVTSEYYTVTVPGHVCNDGSDPVMFFRPSPTGSDNWYIHFQGGGSCHDYDDCIDRWRGADPTYSCAKMSADRFQAPGDGELVVDEGGVLSDLNHLTGLPTLFEDYNRVIFHQCSSDGWKGDPVDPAIPQRLEKTGVTYAVATTRRNAAGVAKVCTAVNHDFAAGDVVEVNTTTNVTYTGTWVVTAVPAANCFQFQQDAALGALAAAANVGTSLAGYDIYFQGHQIVEDYMAALGVGVVSDATSTTGTPYWTLDPLTDADSVVIGGDSGGSGGARINAEYMADWFIANAPGVDVENDELKFVLDATVDSSFERADVNGAADSCDLYTVGPVAVEPVDYTTPTDTYDVFADLKLIDIAETVWSTYEGPPSCLALHPTTPEWCHDANHIVAEHFYWPLFQRQDQEDPSGIPTANVANCAAGAATRQEWGELIQEHFNVLHTYLDGDRNTYAILNTTRNAAGRAKVCLTQAHGFVAGDRVSVRDTTNASFNETCVPLLAPPAANCIQYDQAAAASAKAANTGEVHLAQCTNGSAGIAADVPWWLGKDNAGYTAIPLGDDVAAAGTTPLFSQTGTPDYKSWTPSCARHENILTSNRYYRESMVDSTGATPTMSDAVEDFVTGAGVIPVQVQDPFNAPSGLCP